MAGKKINLGVPDPMADLSAMGGDASAPPSPAMAGSDAGEGGQGPALSYPELHIPDMDPGTIENLPDEGDAHIHYKVTDRGKKVKKHGKDKGKEKHHATLEVHHLTHSGGGKDSKDSDPDNVRKAAKDFFESADESGAPKKKPHPEPDSEMPG